MMGQTGYEINLPEVSESSIFQEFPFTNQSKVQFWTRYRCRHVSLVVIVKKYCSEWCSINLGLKQVQGLGILLFWHSLITTTLSEKNTDCIFVLQVINTRNLMIFSIIKCGMMKQTINP